MAFLRRHRVLVVLLGLELLLLLALPLPLALDQARAVQRHRHLRGQRVEEAPVRALEGDVHRGHLEHDAAQALSLEEQRQRAEQEVAGLRPAALGHEVALLAGALDHGEVLDDQALEHRGLSPDFCGG